MHKKLPSQELKEKLTKVEFSDTVKKQSKITAEEFRKLARAAKSTFKDEDLHPNISF